MASHTPGRTVNGALMRHVATRVSVEVMTTVWNLVHCLTQAIMAVHFTSKSAMGQLV